jgi:hypothetical protein
VRNPVSQKEKTFTIIIGMEPVQMIMAYNHHVATLLPAISCIPGEFLESGLTDTIGGIVLAADT